VTRQRFVVAAGVVGLAVLTVVLFLSSVGGVQTASIQNFQRTGDASKIVVTVLIGLGTEIAERDVREDARTVRVTVRVKQSPGTYPAIGILVPVLVSLDNALGDRIVLDGDGRAVLDLGQYEPPRQPSIDLGEVGVIEKGSFRATGDSIEFAWKDLRGAPHGLSELRGKTVVIHTRTSFSTEGKLTLLELQGYLDSAPTDVRSRVVVLLITLAEDPARAAVVRPSESWRPLLAFADVVELVGGTGPEIFRLQSVPVTWFLSSDGVIRQRVTGKAMTRDEIADAIRTASR